MASSLNIKVRLLVFEIPILSPNSAMYSYNYT